MDQLLKGTLCLANCVLLAGIIGAALGQADRAFDLSFWFRAWQQVSQPPDSASTHFVSNNTTCLPDPQAQTVSMAQFQELQTQLAQGTQFQTLEQVQQLLGAPLCRTQTTQGEVFTYVVSDQGYLLITNVQNSIALQWQPSF